MTGDRSSAFTEMLEKVKLNRPEGAIDSSSDEELMCEADEVFSDGDDKNKGVTTTDLVTTNTEKRIINQFDSAGAEYFKSREFQGLSYEVSAEQAERLDVVPGQSGIASGYTYMDNKKATSEIVRSVEETS